MGEQDGVLGYLQARRNAKAPFVKNLHENYQITLWEQQIDPISRSLQSAKNNESSLQAQLEILQESSEGKTV